MKRSSPESVRAQRLRQAIGECYCDEQFCVLHDDGEVQASAGRSRPLASMSIRPQETLVGQVLDGQLEIVRLLGSGGMGEVYLARHRRMGLPRAVKVIRAKYGETEVIEKRLRREAMVLEELRHPGIVQVLQLGRLETGDVYLVLEYLEGPTLQEYVDTEGPLPLDTALGILAQMAEALSHAHSRGVVHRDLKPDNVILLEGSSEGVKIFDFGLARLLSNEGLTRLTLESHLLGTPAYMSPEQCETGEVSGAADVYALGGIAYFLLSGLPPFSCNSPTAYVLAHCGKTPEPIDARCPHLGIPPALRELLLDCLAKVPDARPTAEDLEAQLRRLHWEVRFRDPEAQENRVALTPGAARDQRASALSPGVSNQPATGHRAGMVPVTDSPDTSRRAPSPGAVLDSMHAKAQMIWVDQHERFSDLDHISSEWAQQEGLCNQISTAMVELAEDVVALPGAPVALGPALGQLKELEARLTDVEMDLALAESRMTEARARAAHTSHAAEIEGQYRRLMGHCSRLTRGINRSYREIYTILLTYGSQVSDPVLLDYFTELGELVEHYLRWTEH